MLCLGHLYFEFRYCFGFRSSYFGFFTNSVNSAQSLGNYLCELGDLCGYDLFMQNKPNFPENPPFVTSCKSRASEYAPRFLAQKSQTQCQKRQNEHKLLLYKGLWTTNYELRTKKQTQTNPILSLAHSLVVKKRCFFVANPIKWTPGDCGKIATRINRILASLLCDR